VDRPGVPSVVAATLLSVNAEIVIRDPSVLTTVNYPMEYGQCVLPTKVDGPADPENLLKELRYPSGASSLREVGSQLQVPFEAVPEALQGSKAVFDSTLEGMRPCKKDPPSCGKKHCVWTVMEPYNHRKRNSNDGPQQAAREFARNEEKAAEALAKAIKAAVSGAKTCAHKLGCGETCPKRVEVGFTWLKAFIILRSAGEGYYRAEAWAYAQYGIECITEWEWERRRQPSDPGVDPGGGTPTPPDPGGGTPTPLDPAPDGGPRKLDRRVATPVNA
jgi:hypothetical protein